jgi:hypothetical protein
MDGENESVVSFVTEECRIRGCTADSDGEGSKINVGSKFNDCSKIQVLFIMLIQDRMWSPNMTCFHWYSIASVA